MRAGLAPTVALLLMVAGATAQDSKPSAATADTRASLASLIERNFLRNGVDMNVFSWEKAKPALQDAFNQHPRLTFFGWQDRAFVYQVLEDGTLLARAREAGFKGVEFFDRGPNGRWMFDISGTSLPRCDVKKRLCL